MEQTFNQNGHYFNIDDKGLYQSIENTDPDLDIRIHSLFWQHCFIEIQIWEFNPTNRFTWTEDLFNFAGEVPLKNGLKVLL